MTNLLAYEYIYIYIPYTSNKHHHSTYSTSYASDGSRSWLDDKGVRESCFVLNLPVYHKLIKSNHTTIQIHFNSQFLQGLGLAQSMPGPLFNFSSYLGAVYKGVAGQ